MTEENKKTKSETSNTKIRIGFITSGGDCSGMNAAVRAIVRHAIKLGLDFLFLFVFERLSLRFHRKMSIFSSNSLSQNTQKLVVVVNGVL
jgi:hypothetical protein